ncbi:MAG: Copper resistance protein A [Hyphomicrobiaceae bacterium hypho_1]
MVSTSPNAPPPVLRVKKGARFIVDVTNTLTDPTAMHWHGMRVPNKIDGVPYLMQWPIIKDETWRYDFKVDDAGTY